MVPSDNPSDDTQPSPVLLASQKMNKERAVMHTPVEEPGILNVLRHIPWFAAFVGHTGDSINAFGKIKENTSDTFKDVTKSFSYADIVFKAIDFFYIPAVYLAYAYVKKPAPITLSRNARWFYAAVLFSLAIVALTVPTAAIIIAFSTASVGLVLSIGTLAKAFYRPYQVKKELVAFDELIQARTEQLDDCLQYTKELELQLQTASTEEEKGAIQAELDKKLQSFYLLNDEQKKDLQTKFECEEELLSLKTTTAMVDKCMAVALGSLGLLGLTLSLFFPPVAAILGAIGAIIGGVYLLGRLSLHFYDKWTTPHNTIVNKTETPQEMAEHTDVSPSPVLQKTLQSEAPVQAKTAEPPAMQSTARALDLMGVTALSMPSQGLDTDLEDELEPGLSTHRKQALAKENIPRPHTEDDLAMSVNQSKH